MERVFDLLPDADFELDLVALNDFDAVGEEVLVFVVLEEPDSLMEAEGVVVGGITETDFDDDLDKLTEVEILDVVDLVTDEVLEID